VTGCGALMSQSLVHQGGVLGIDGDQFSVDRVTIESQSLVHQGGVLGREEMLACHRCRRSQSLVHQGGVLGESLHWPSYSPCAVVSIPCSSGRRSRARSPRHWSLVSGPTIGVSIPCSSGRRSRDISPTMLLRGGLSSKSQSLVHQGGVLGYPTPYTRACRGNLGSQSLVHQGGVLGC